MFRMKSLIVGVMLFASLPCLNMQAWGGDGFPPFGAWAYGTGGAGHARWGHTGWAGHYGYRHRHVGFGGFHRSYFHSNCYSSYRIHSAFPVAYCPPVVYRPAILYQPTFVYRGPTVSYWSASNCWYPPAVYCGSPWGGSYSTSGISLSVGSIGWPLAGTTLSTRTRSAIAPAIAARQTSVQSSSALADMSINRPNTQAHYVVLNPETDNGLDIANGIVVPQPVPVELLTAADRILQAGGFAEAAAAYARLTARYGSNPQLLGRRFVAQVLSHDFDQAAVIAASARLLEQPLERELLPATSLAGLSIAATTARLLAEELAEYAFARTDDAASLAAVAYWLSLSGEEEKSSLFMARVEQLEKLQTTTGPRVVADTQPSAGRSKTNFTSLK